MLDKFLNLNKNGKANLFAAYFCAAAGVFCLVMHPVRALGVLFFIQNTALSILNFKLAKEMKELNNENK